MAFVLRRDENNGNFVVLLCGCQCPGSSSAGCGCRIEVYSQPFSMDRATAIIKLHLHAIFGRQHRLEEIMAQYENYFENEAHSNENRIGVWHKIIFESFEQDSDWKMCPACQVRGLFSKLLCYCRGNVRGSMNLAIGNGKMCCSLSQLLLVVLTTNKVQTNLRVLINVSNVT